jgi:DNA-binding FadR family transcriptional regulator
MGNNVTLKKIKSKSVVQQIIDNLTDAMIRKELQPGDKIPTETELASEMGVGRNSVREAIKILEYLGVLEIKRAEGTFVCNDFSEAMIDPMIYGIILDKSDSADKLMELREMMEVGVTKLAMNHLDQDKLEELEERMLKLQAEINRGADNVNRVFEADNEFHEIITAMGNNPLVEKINQVVRILTHSMRYQTVERMLIEGRGQELYEAHKKIYEMLSNKNMDNINELVRGTYFYDLENK